MELVDRRVVYSMVVGWEHAEVALFLGAELQRFVRVRSHRLGRVGVAGGFCLKDDASGTIRGADVAFISKEHENALRREGFQTFPPDLAVEVESPGDREREIERKVRGYLEGGSARAWVVRPNERTISVHRKDGAAVVFGAWATLSSDDAGFAVEGFALSLDR